MGTKERRERERLVRKNDIIDAAETVFFKKGIQQATMDEVAKEAEFSKRTIYIYFQSKEQLYFEIMLRAHRNLNNMMTEALASHIAASSLEKINIMGRTFYKFSKVYPNHLKAILDYQTTEDDFESIDDVILACYEEGEKSLNYLKDAIRQGIVEGSIIEDIDVNYMAVILWTNMIAVFNLTWKKENYLKHYHHCDGDRLIDVAIDLIIRGISK